MSIDSESLLEMRKVRSPSWLHAGFSRFPLERELILCVLASLLLALTDCTKPAPPPAPLESVTRPGARPHTRVCVWGGAWAFYLLRVLYLGARRVPVWGWGAAMDPLTVLKAIGAPVILGTPASLPAPPADSRGVPWRSQV